MKRISIPDCEIGERFALALSFQIRAGSRVREVEPQRLPNARRQNIGVTYFHLAYNYYTAMPNIQGAENVNTAHKRSTSGPPNRKKSLNL